MPVLASTANMVGERRCVVRGHSAWYEVLVCTAWPISYISVNICNSHSAHIKVRVTS